MRSEKKNRFTRPWCLILFLGFGLAMVSCGTPRSVEAPQAEAVAPDASDQLYAQAEDLFHYGNLDQALAAFKAYLYEYPQSRFADQAMLRIADILRLSGDTETARAFYQRLVEEFPYSPWADQARIDLIDLLISQKDPQAIMEISQMLAGELSGPVRQALLERLSFLYPSEGTTPADSARYLYLVYESESGRIRQDWLDRLKVEIEKLTVDDIPSLWDFMVDDTARSYLMFRYAMLQVMTERNDQALDLLKAFLAAYPGHPLAMEAAAFADTLGQRRMFQPFTVGCLLPLTGPYQTYGLRALNGIELALNRMSQGDGAPQIKIVVRDTASRDAQAVKGVQDLAAARVAAIIGPIVTAPVAAQEAQRLGVPMLTFTQKPGIGDIGEWIFRHFITPQNQVDILTEYLFDDLGLSRLAVMYPQETYGQTFMELFWDAVIRRQGALTGVEAYDPKLTDFADVIQKLVGAYYPIPKDLAKPSLIEVPEPPYLANRLQSRGNLDGLFPDPLTRYSGLYGLDSFSLRTHGAESRSQDQEDDLEKPIIDFDALFIPDAPNKVGLIIPQLAFYDVRDVILVGTNLWHSEQLIEMTKDYAQNALMVDGFFRDSQSQAVQTFIQEFKVLYQEEPGIIEAFSFDTAHLIFSLLARPDIHSFQDIRLALQQSISLQGATGPVYFVENGEAIKRLTLLRIKGGRFVEVAIP